VEEAWAHVFAWLAAENVWIPEPSPSHAKFLGEALRHVPEGGEFVHDAHLAALAMEYGLTLYSADRDFARFPGLKWMNPLA
jgi:predicted nucleic acid-binding protein